MVGDILSPTHLLFVLVVALLVLGPKRLPEVGRQLGNGLRDFRSAINGERSEREEAAPRQASVPLDPAPLQGAPTAGAPAQPDFSYGPAATYEPAATHVPAAAYEPPPLYETQPAYGQQPSAFQPAPAYAPTPDPVPAYADPALQAAEHAVAQGQPAAPPPAAFS